MTGFQGYFSDSWTMTKANFNWNDAKRQTLGSLEALPGGGTLAAGGKLAMAFIFLKKANISVTFGQDANQIHHTFRHVKALGLNPAEVQKAVLNHFAKVHSNVPDGKSLNQVIEVAGQKVQYSAFRLPDGSYNIGRMHAPNAN